MPSGTRARRTRGPRRARSPGCASRALRPLAVGGIASAVAVRVLGSEITGAVAQPGAARDLAGIRQAVATEGQTELYGGAARLWIHVSEKLPVMHLLRLSHQGTQEE